MKGIITVLGQDHVGIIGSLCTCLANCNVNILDISQTIVDGYFDMIMVVDISGSAKPFSQLVDELAELGRTLDVEVRLQHEEIFRSMHRV